MKTVAQINFRYHMPTPAYLEMCNQTVAAVSRVDGLLWKIWLTNEAAKQSGGIYLFEDVDSADAYIRGPLVQTLCDSPDISDVQIQLSHTNDGLSAVTHGPLQMVVPVRTSLAPYASDLPYFMWS